MLISVIWKSLKGDVVKIAAEIWLYRGQLGLTAEHLSKLGTAFNQKFTEIVSKSQFASILLLKDLNSLTSVLLKTLPILILSNNAIDVLRVLPAAEGIIHGTISFASQKLALINILEEFSKISTDLHSLADKTKCLTNTTSVNTVSPGFRRTQIN